MGGSTQRNDGRVHLAVGTVQVGVGCVLGSIQHRTTGLYQPVRLVVGTVEVGVGCRAGSVQHQTTGLYQPVRLAVGTVRYQAALSDSISKRWWSFSSVPCASVESLAMYLKQEVIEQ